MLDHFLRSLSDYCIALTVGKYVQAVTGKTCTHIVQINCQRGTVALYALISLRLKIVVSSVKAVHNVKNSPRPFNRKKFVLEILPSKDAYKQFDYH